MRSDDTTPKRPRRTTAGRLLAALSPDDPSLLTTLATRLGVEVSLLEQCRDGLGSLDLERQMRLAAHVVELAPRHARLAHKLYGQAQAALRMELHDDRRHESHPNTRFY